MFACVEGWGKWDFLGSGKGLENEAVHPGHGTGTGRSLHSRTKGNNSKKEGFSFTLTESPPMH
jgi:hypothetical protein